MTTPFEGSPEQNRVTIVDVARGILADPSNTASACQQDATRSTPDRIPLASPSSDPSVRIGFVNANERRQVLEWLGAGLRPQQVGRLPLEYPHLFGRNPSAIHMSLWSEGAPVAFCTLWAVRFRIGLARLRSGMISLVYTDAARRGRGHAHRLIQAAIAEAERLELGMVLLWSDLDRLYRPLGFDRAGCESLLIIDKPTLEKASARSSSEALATQEAWIEDATASDWPEIERLRGQRICQLELDAGELGRSQNIPELSVRVARNAAGVQAFAMRGRGDDFAEVIHEWGGDPDMALECCRALTEDCEPWNELFFLSPSSQDELAWLLRRAGARVIRQPLAWMRIASCTAFASDVDRLLAEPIGLELAVTSASEEPDRRFEMRSRRGVAHVEQSVLLKALFGSARPVERAALNRSLADPLGAANLDHLPIPFFVWGLESI